MLDSRYRRRAFLSRCFIVLAVVIALPACTENPATSPIGAPVSGHLAGGERYEALFACEPMRMALVVVEQDNLDVLLEITAAESSGVRKFDSAALRFGAEIALIECEDDATQRVVVRSKQGRTPGGAFNLTMYWLTSASSSNLAAAYRNLSEAARIHALGGKDAWPLAVDHLQLSIRLARKIDRADLEALAEHQLASMYYLKLLDWNRAADHARRAVDLYGSLNDAHGAAASATLRGAALEEAAFALGDTDDAASAIFEEAERVLLFARNEQRRLGRRFDAAMSLDYLAICHYYAGRYNEAIAAFEDAEREFLGLREEPARAMVLQNLATILAEFGQYKEAQRAFENLLPLVSHEEDTLAYAAAAANYVSALRGAGDVEGALAQAFKVLELNKLRGDLGGEARTLHKIADIYQELGDLERSLQFYGDALPKARLANQRRFVFRILTSMGAIHREVGDLDRAAGFHAEAMKSAREGLDTAELRLEIGLDRAAQGRHEAALEDFRASLNAMPAHRNPYFPRALIEEGRTLRLLRRVAEAKASLRRAMKAMDAPSGTDRPLETSIALRELAIAELASGNRAAALRYSTDAIDVLESVQSRALSPAIRASLRESGRATYALRINILMGGAEDSQGSDSTRIVGAATRDALIAAESGRARWLFETHALSGAFDAEFDALLDALGERRTALASLERSAGVSAKTLAVQKDIAMIRAKLDLKERSMGAARPAAAPRSTFDERGLLALQDSLPEHTAAVEFFLSSPHSWAWVVRRREMHAIRLTDRLEIEASATELNQLLRTPGRPDALVAAARKTYQLTLGPALEEISASDLVVVPDGVLHTIPLSTIMRVSSPSATLRTLSIAPSFSMLSRPRIVTSPPRSPPRVAIVAGRYSGEQRLPAIETERAAIVRTLGLEGSAIMGDHDFDRRTFMTMAFADYDVLHIAAHAQSDAVYPAMSRILFAFDERPDATVRFTDIARLSLPLDLVVLSGCETGAGRRLSGDGLASLSTAFVSAGARSVISSLWRVPDEATSVLMGAFYTALRKDGLSPAQALRSAEAEVRSHKKWSHPYFWGGFTVIDTELAQ
ncbi:MAG: CHAT domain-containing protein [Steroidobacter sp.]